MTSASISVSEKPASPAQLHSTIAAVTELENALEKVLEFTGFAFDPDQPHRGHHSGERGAHRCHYRISLPGEVFVGHLEVSRAWPFRESELRLLECCLADFYLRLNLLVPQHQQVLDQAAGDRTP